MFFFQSSRRINKRNSQATSPKQNNAHERRLAVRAPEHGSQDTRSDLNCDFDGGARFNFPDTPCDHTILPLFWGDPERVLQGGGRTPPVLHL